VSSTQAEGGSKLKQRHGLSRVLMAGESADADEKAEDSIVNVLPGLIEGYAAEVFFTMLTKQDFSLNACRTKRTRL
jgi:hypothetical protein